MSDWRHCSLAEVATIEKGSLRVPYDGPGSVNSIGAIELEGGDSGRPVVAKGATLCEPEDVVMLWDGERSGLVGRGRRGAVGSTVARIRPSQQVDGAFLYHALRSQYSLIQGQRTGTGVPHVQRDLGRRLTLRLPSLREQRRIAEVLDTVDDAIRSAEHLTAKLNEVAAAVERETVAALYNGPTASLSEHASVERGRFVIRPRNDPRFFGGDMPFIQTADVVAAARGVIGHHFQTLNASGERASRAFPQGTIAVTIAANIADTAILDRAMCFPDSVVGVVARSGVNPRWLEICIAFQRSSLVQRAPQSAQKNINLTDLRPLPIPVIDASAQASVAAVWERGSRRLGAERARLRALEQLRVGLADDLLSGRVRTVAA